MDEGNSTGLQVDNATNSSSNGTTRAFLTYFNREADIVLGLCYLFFGLFGIFSNGSALWSFWSARRTIRVMPFTLCAIVLAANDCVLCLLGVTPYAALILANRPLVFQTPIGSFNWTCKIFGFVNNFCDRFAWFDITGIMLFRCISMLFPIKLRGMSYAPFIYILSLLALLQGVICALPFFNLEMMYDKYVYSPNYGECAYNLNPIIAPAMIIVVDVLWWGPFLICAVSSVIFIIAMKLHAAKFSGISKSGSGMDAKKKTLILTAFFLACYFPKALLGTFNFIRSRGLLDSYKPSDSFYTTLVYLTLLCKFLIPAFRAAFTPTMLRLQEYLRMCDTSKRKGTRPNRSTVSLITGGLTNMRERLARNDSFKKLKVVDERVTNGKDANNNEQSQLV